MISDYFDRKCTCVHAEILSCETATVHFTENQNAGHLVLTNKTQFNRYVSLLSKGSRSSMWVKGLVAILATHGLFTLHGKEVGNRAATANRINRF